MTFWMGAAAAQPEADDRPVEDAKKHKLAVKAEGNLPTVYLIGDSTVKVGTPSQRGWGDELAPFFNTDKINVVNHAIGGRSSRTFQTEGRWDASLAMMKKGDFLLIQFGHNDTGAINDDKRARASLKGTGGETEEIDNILTKRHEVVHTFGWYLRKYVREAKAKGVVPVICSPIPRKSWQDGKINRVSGSYGKWAREVAEQEGALFIDLNEIIAREYEKLGPEKVEPLFADKGTHTSFDGAKLNARCVVAGLRGLAGKPFDANLSEEGLAVPPFVEEK
ncbi:MAG: rhamnogalacturonan acetylesterase [Luteolibacter sp.]